MAAARALAELAKEDVPESVSRGYGGERFSFGRDYIIPKPLDPRVLLWVAPAVAEAAMASGVARIQLDLAEYRERLKKRQSRVHGVMSLVHGKARSKLARIVFPEGDAEKIQHAAQILREEGLCEPILLGPVQKIRASIEERRLDGLEGVQVIHPEESPDYDRYVSRFWELRARKGMTFAEARRQLRARNYFGSMMVERGDADGMVTGLTVGYPDGIRAPLEVIGTRKGRRAAGVYIVVTKDDFKFFADTTVNIDPNPQALADIAVATADLARYFDVTPRVAMLSYSSFGAAKGESPAKVRKATELVRQMRPDLEIDGEIQVDIATDAELRGPGVPLLDAEGGRQRLRLPQPRRGQHLLPAARGHGRRRGHRARAARHGQAGERAADGDQRAVDRQPGGHHGAAGPGRAVHLLAPRRRHASVGAATPSSPGAIDRSTPGPVPRRGRPLFFGPLHPGVAPFTPPSLDSADVVALRRSQVARRGRRGSGRWPSEARTDPANPSAIASPRLRAWLAKLSAT